MNHNNQAVTMKINIRALTVLSLLIGILGYFSYCTFILDDSSIYEENGIMENSQVVLQIAAIMVFLYTALTQQRNDKLILVFFSWLCLSFFLREIDVEYLDIPETIKWFGHGTGRALLLVSTLLAILIYAFTHFTYYKKLSMEFILSYKMLGMISAGLLLVTGEVFENITTLKHNIFMEEAFEFAGYGLILIMAILFSKPQEIDTIK